MLQSGTLIFQQRILANPSTAAVQLLQQVLMARKSHISAQLPSDNLPAFPTVRLYAKQDSSVRRRVLITDLIYDAGAAALCWNGPVVCEPSQRGNFCISHASVYTPQTAS